MNQKDAVFLAIKELKRGAVDTETPVTLTKQEKKVVEQKLFEGFKKGRVAYNHEMPSDDKLALYISGLVSNWLRKDKRLNGQRNYVPQRPGSRTTPQQLNTSGIDQEQLEALRRLAGGGGDVQIFVVKAPAPAPVAPAAPNPDTEPNKE